MNEQVFLQGLSILGLLLCVVVFWYTTIPLRDANGTRPTYEFILVAMAIEILWAFAVAYVAFFRDDRLPEDGILLAISLFARVKPILFAIGSFRLSYRLNNQKTDYHHGDKHTYEEAN